MQIQSTLERDQDSPEKRQSYSEELFWNKAYALH